MRTPVAGVILSVLVLAGFSFGEVSIGLDLNSDLQTKATENTNNSNKTTVESYELRLGPVVGFTLGEKIEIAPTAGGIYYQTETDNNGNKSKDSYGGIFAGCGLYFRLVQSEFLRFSLGPQYWLQSIFQNNQFFTGISMPANLDVKPGGPWKVRLAISMVDILFWHSENGTKVNGFQWHMRSILTPGLTVFYSF